jgi:NAD(P)H-dependent FMN reductase
VGVRLLYQPGLRAETCILPGGFERVGGCAYNPAMKPLIISCSLNPESRSAVLARQAHGAFEKTCGGARLIDLRETVLPMCDGGAAYQHESVGPLATAISGADPVLLSVPVYNYDANAAAKNLIELTGRAWTGKVVGFMCAAGGKSSYMSVMSLANSLMLDFRCLIVPRFVYATGEDFNEDGSLNETIIRRTDELCETAAGLARAWSQASTGA